MIIEEPDQRKEESERAREKKGDEKDEEEESRCGSSGSTTASLADSPAHFISPSLVPSLSLASSDRQLSLAAISP